MLWHPCERLRSFFAQLHTEKGHPSISFDMSREETMIYLVLPGGAIDIDLKQGQLHGKPSQLEQLHHKDKRLTMISSVWASIVMYILS